MIKIIRRLAIQLVGHSIVYVLISFVLWDACWIENIGSVSQESRVGVLITFLSSIYWIWLIEDTFFNKLNKYENRDKRSKANQ